MAAIQDEKNNGNINIYKRNIASCSTS